MLKPSTLIVCGGFLLACGQPTTEAPEAAPETPAPAAAPSEPAAAAPAFTRQAAPTGARAYIIEPGDGATVSSPVRVVFGLEGYGVVPAGIERENAGHHHLLIDTDPPDMNLPIPADDNHRHFGGGQTEAEIELSQGTHRLQLLLGDHLHVPHDPPIMSEVVTIEVR